MKITNPSIIIKKEELEKYEKYRADYYCKRSYKWEFYQLIDAMTLVYHIRRIILDPDLLSSKIEVVYSRDSSGGYNTCMVEFWTDEHGTVTDVIMEEPMSYTYRGALGYYRTLASRGNQLISIARDLLWGDEEDIRKACYTCFGKIMSCEEDVKILTKIFNGE